MKYKLLYMLDIVMICKYLTLCLYTIDRDAFLLWLKARDANFIIIEEVLFFSWNTCFYEQQQRTQKEQQSLGLKCTH